MISGEALSKVPFKCRSINSKNLLLFEFLNVKILKMKAVSLKEKKKKIENIKYLINIG